jgi:hypothetical protein
MEFQKQKAVLWRTNGMGVVPIHIYAESCMPGPHYANWVSVDVDLYIVEEVDLVPDETGDGKVLDVVGVRTHRESVLAKEGSVVVGVVSAMNNSGDIEYPVCGVVNEHSLGINFGSCTYHPFISVSIYGIKYIECPSEYELARFAKEFLASENIKIKPQSDEQLVYTLLALYVINKLQNMNKPA